MPSSKAPRLLLIGNDPILARIYACALTASNYSVDVASGAEGFDRLLAGQYQVVVSDVSQPADALDLLKKIRRWRPGVPVVLLTHELDEQAYDQVREMGMVRCLAKPMTMEQLARAVDGVSMLRASRIASTEHTGTRR